MFEKILEKVLENYFGRFVSGLDKNNLKLGVWSGNVAIENVTLKPEVIELLELPIKLKYSKIGKMHFKIPWKKLSSAPVEILIDNLYLTVSPLLPNEWNFSDQVIVEKKFQLLMDYCRECMAKSLKKKKKENAEEDQSYLDKLTTKIIDNIQLRITNIHFRWELEDTDLQKSIYKQSHSWGITLQSLNIETTDDLWRKQFVDRTEGQTRFTAMNRLFELKNLAIYWNQFEREFMRPTMLYTDYMDTRIYRDDGALAKLRSDFIITISSEVKVIQNPPKKVYLPLYHSEISLQWLDLQLKKNQFKQLLNLLESFSVYTNLLWVQRKKAQDLSEQAISDYQGFFQDLFVKVYLSEAKQLDVLAEHEVQLFRSILRSVGYENLIQWTKVVAKKMIKENRVTALTMKKSKKESSWWNTKSKDKSKDKQVEEISEQELNDIEGQIEKLFEEQSEIVSEIIRPKDSIEKRFEFVFKGGGIQITTVPKESQRIAEEGLKLNYNDMYCIVEILNDGSLEVIFKLKNLETSLLTQYVGQNVIYTPFLQKSRRAVVNEDQFFKLMFQKHVEVVLQQQNDKKSDPQMTAALSLQIQPVECIYNPVFVKRFLDFFETQDVDESLKTATWDKIEALQDQTQNKVDYILNSAIKLNLQLDVASPILILPFTMNNDAKSECWIINLGNLRMSTGDSGVAYYDCYNIQLMQTQFQYFPSIEYYYSYKESEPSELIYSVVETDTIAFRLHRLKKSLKGLPDVPVLKVEGDLPPMHLNLTVYLHGHMLQISRLLFPANSDNEQIEILQNEKNAILANKVIQGQLKQKDRSMNLWNTYHAVCSGAYIYFFKDAKDIQHDHYVYIKRAELHADGEWGFHIVNRYEKIMFACTSEDDFKQWMSILQDQIGSFVTEPQFDASIVSSQVSVQSIEQSQEVKQQQVVTVAQLALSVKRITITLQQNDLTAPSIYQLQLDEFRYHQVIGSNKSMLEWSVQSLRLVDYIHPYRKPDFQTFISSGHDDANPCLTYRMVQTKVDNENWFTEQEYAIEYLFINWKPDVILKLSELFASHQSTITTLQEDEANLRLQGYSDEQIKAIQLDQLVRNVKPTNAKAHSQHPFKWMLSRDSLIENLGAVTDTFLRDGMPLSEHQLAAALQVVCRKSISIGRAHINLLHQQTHVCLGYLELEGFQRSVQMTQTASFSEGVIQDAVLYDTTDYPSTIDSNLVDWEAPSRVVYKQEGCDGALVTFTQSAFENLNQQVTHFLDLGIAPCVLTYAHQPFMRMLNYILVQIMSLIYTPEYLTMNQHYDSANRHQPKLVAGTIQQIFESIMQPSFSAIRIFVDAPIIRLARTFKDNHCVELVARNAVYSNTQTQDPSRMVRASPAIDLPVWCDVQFIKVQELHLRMAGKRISNVCTYQLDWTRLLHGNEFKQLFPEVKLRTHYNLQSYMTPLRLELMHQDYLYLCAVFMFNFTHDDGMDHLFIHDYHVYRSFAPTEIRYMIFLPQLSLYMKNDYDAFIACLALEQVQVEYLLEQSTNKSIKFYAHTIEFSEFDDLQQFVIIGKLGPKRTYLSRAELHSEIIDSEAGLEQFQELRHRDFRTKFNAKQERKSSLQLQRELAEKQQFQFLADVIIEKNSPVREIIIGFNAVQMSAKTRKVFMLVDWISLTPECYPPHDSTQSPGLAVMVNITNSFLSFPTKVPHEAILTARGNINYIFDKQTHKHAKVQNSHKVTLNNLEVFLFDGTNKRQVVLPILLYFGMQDEFDRTFLLRKMDMTFDRTCIKVSHDDLKVIFAAIEYQKSQFFEEEEPAPMESSIRMDYYMLNSSIVPEQYQRLITLQCVIYAIQVVVISSEEMPVPQFDLFLNECQIQYTAKQHQYLYNIQSQIQSSHYNNRLGIWEPFLEPFVFQIDQAHHEKGNPKQYLNFIVNPDKYSHIPCNINITAPILKKLQNLVSVWQDSFSSIATRPVESLKTVQHAVLDVDAILAVSPYLINNQTGHPITAKSFTKTFNYDGSTQQQREVSLTVVAPHQTSSIKFKTSYDSLFQQSFNTSDRYTVERRKIALTINSDIGVLAELPPLDFDRLYNKKLALDMVVSKQVQKVNVIISLEVVNEYKRLTVSSDLQVTNRSQRSVDIRMLLPATQQVYAQTKIASNEQYHIPIGMENCALQFRYTDASLQPDANWSKFIDLGKVRQQSGDATFDLSPQSKQSLIFLVQRANQNRLHTLMILQCPHVIRNTLPVQVNMRIWGVDKEYQCPAFQDLKVAEVQPTQEFKVTVKLPGFQFSPSLTLVQKNPQGSQFTVRDYLGIEMQLRFIYIGQEEGFYTFILEGGMIIQSTLGRPVYMYGRYLTQREKESKGKVQQHAMGPLHPQMEYLAGQPLPEITEAEDIAMRNGAALQVAREYELMQLSFQPGGEVNANREQFSRTNFSQQFPVKEGMGRYLVRIPFGQGYMDTVAQTTNIVVDSSLNLISPMLTIHPKCIIINQFDRDLLLKQNGPDNSQIVINQGQRVPLYWFTGFSKYLQFHYLGEQGPCKTGFIGLEISGSLTCPTRNTSDQSIQDYIVVSSFEEDKIQFIKVEPSKENQKPLYLVQNRLPGVRVQFYQSCYEEISINLKTVLQPYEEKPYAFDHPTHPKEVVVELIGDENTYIGMMNVDMTHAEWVGFRTVELPQKKQLQFYIHSYFSITNRQIVVSFTHEKPRESKASQNETGLSDMIESQLEIVVPQLNISLISTPQPNYPRRREVVLVHLQGMEFVQVSDEHLQTSQFVIRDIQIDSNRLARCYFPVMLTLANPELRTPIPLISCVIQRAPQVDFANYFKSIKIAVQPLAVKTTEGTLEDLYLSFLDLSTEQQGQQKRLSQEALVSPLFEWQLIELQSSQLCFIEKIEIYPFKFTLSFQMQEATGKELKRFLKPPPGQSLLSIDTANINLHGISAENVQQTLTQFYSRLRTSYQDDFTSNLLKIIGSMDILGDPMGLIRNVGGGFQDLYEMPKEGFIKGPIEGGIGIAKGVGSLTKGFVSGTFNTVQKITGSLAQGFSAITMDDEYQQERAVMGAKKPKHLVDGVGQGMISLFTGVGQGIAGLVLQPVQGAERDGVEGFLKGTMKGLAGLVVKPVVGVMDFTSKTAEGIKNTANFFDDKPNEKRYRPPRVFYGTEQYYRTFKMQDSEMVELLSKWPNLPFKDSVDLLECIPYLVQNRLFMYVLTFKLFILLDVSNRSLKFEVPSSSIKGTVRVSGTELHIHLTQNLKKSSDPSKTAGVSYEQSRIRLCCNNEQFVTTLSQRIKHLLEILQDQQ